MCFYLFHSTQLVPHNAPPPDTDSSCGLFYRKSCLKPPNAKLLTEGKLLEIGRAKQRVGGIFCTDDSDRTRVKRFGVRFRLCVIDNQIKMHFRKIKHQLTEVYINDPIDSDGEGNALTLADIFSSNVNVENDVELKIYSEKLYKYIKEELTDREREIICKRYGVPNIDGALCKPLTQREIAKQLGISRSYISRIEKRALEKLRTRFDE